MQFYRILATVGCCARTFGWCFPALSRQSLSAAGAGNGRAFVLRSVGRAGAARPPVPRMMRLGSLVIAVLLGLSGLPAPAQTRLQAPAPPPASTTGGDQDPAPQLRGLGPPDAVAPPPGSLEELRLESIESAGAMFVKPDEVLVKPPLLKALIRLDKRMSPYQLDATSEAPVSLSDVVKTALRNNLPVKIARADSEAQRWNYYGALGGFLPTMENDISYQDLSGKYASPFGVRIPVNSPFLTIVNSLSYGFFQGGKVLFGSLQAKHQYNAARHVLTGTTNDVLLEAAKLYYQLVLSDVVLQIRVKAVQTSTGLYLRNQDLYANGANTKLDVLQARTQLSRDRQHLIEQQIARRQAAVNLATALNLDTAVDLTVKDRTVSKIRLVSEALTPNDLLQIAIDNRPELKKYTELRIAARNAVKVARAALLPTVTGTITGAATAADTVSGSANAQSAAVATGGLAPGAFSTTTVAPVGAGAGGSRFAMTELLALGVAVQWTLGGMGVVEAAKVQSAKWQMRRAQLEFQQELAKVYQEVRNAYLNTIDADNLITETTDAVNSSKEQLEVATIRLQEGVGTDLDVVNAQRDYTNALVDKAQAIIKFNIAQAELLRAMGRISLSTLTSPAPLRQ